MGELKGTGVHVAKPLLLWERGQTEVVSEDGCVSLGECADAGRFKSPGGVNPGLYRMLSHFAAQTFYPPVLLAV